MNRIFKNKWLSLFVLFFFISISTLTLISCGGDGGDMDTIEFITWTATFGGSDEEEGKCVQQTSDGGYIVVGFTRSFGVGLSDIYLIKTDANGNALWSKTYGDLENEWGYSVQETSDGGYIITGYTYPVGTNQSEVYLIKTDGNGVIVWTRTFGGGADDFGFSVQQTTDGGYIIAGRTHSFGAGGGDVYLIKTNENGNALWTKTFGGNHMDSANSVQQTTDGGYIIAGETGSFGAGIRDVYLIKTDENGNELWSKTFGGTTHDSSFSVKQTSDSGYIIAGYTSSSLDNEYIYLIKTDENGNLLWSKTFSDKGNGVGMSVYQTTDGGYVITGGTAAVDLVNSDVDLIKTDENGNEIWSNTFGGIGRHAGLSVQQTSDGGYIIVGFKAEFYDSVSEDVYLIKTDSNGNIF